MSTRPSKDLYYSLESI